MKNECTCNARLGTEHKPGCAIHMTVEPTRYRVGDGPWIARAQTPETIAAELTGSIRQVFYCELTTHVSEFSRPGLKDAAYSRLEAALVAVFKASFPPK